MKNQKAFIRIAGSCLCWILPTLLMAFIVVGCKSRGTGQNESARPAADDEDAGGSLYLTQNVHVMDTRRRGGYRYLASYLNFTDPGEGHMIIPVNTEVSFGRARNGFLMRMVGDRQSIVFEYNSRHIGMSARAYQQQITSSAPIPLSGFSDLDLRGIGEGKPHIGMTREGIRIALGFPSPHMTASLDAPQYIYWKDQRQQFTVAFDENGKVISIR